MTSVISAFYYLRVVYLMFMFDGEVEVIAEAGARHGRGRHRRRYLAAGRPARLGLQLRQRRRDPERAGDDCRGLTRFPFCIEMKDGRLQALRAAFFYRACPCFLEETALLHRPYFARVEADDRS